MAKIRHIAFYTDDPEKEADFYVRAFELKRVRTSPTGSVFLSDGYINLALLKAKGDGTKNGIHHFVFPGGQRRFSYRAPPWYTQGH